MANQEHLDIMRQGIKVWNAWRDKNLNIMPDLRYADLRYGVLVHADLRYTDLRGAVLMHASLVDADLVDADLRYADLRGVNLHYANLSQTDLREADLREADFARVSLFRAKLSRADLREARLSLATGLTVDQIKAARDWELAMYSDDFRAQLGLPPAPPNFWDIL